MTNFYILNNEKIFLNFFQNLLDIIKNISIITQCIINNCLKVILN
jgi:hypothetical protein